MRSIQGWLFAVCLLVAFDAAADPRPVRLDVSTTVVTNCRIAVSDLAFDSYDPLGSNATAAADGKAAVRVSCTRSASAEVELESGDQQPGQSRSMTSSDSGRVVYQLYRDAGHTRPWSSGSQAVRLVSDSARRQQQFVVYGRIPPGQDVRSGTYTDVVRATVHF